MKRRAMVGLVILSAGCGGAEGSREAVPEEPLVIESPNVKVVVGDDTTEVFAPTVFGYFATDLGEGDPPPALVASMVGFQQTLQEAAPGLEALGVRVIPVGEVPTALRIPGEVEAAAGPPLQPGGSGFLLVSPRGRVRRLDRSASGVDLVCAAVGLFGMDPPPLSGMSCR